jgi:hypothetical protein
MGSSLWRGRLGLGLHCGLAVSATIEVFGRDTRTMKTCSALYQVTFNEFNEESQKLNPYSAPRAYPQTSVAVEDGPRGFKVGKSILVWSTVCSISAAPSFVIGTSVVGVPNLPWMVLGILIFICIYVTADWLSCHWMFRRRVAVRMSLFITYIIRITASIIFPIALYADIFCGTLSASVLTELGYDPIRSIGMPGPIVLVWTLMQGILLNVVLASIWVVLLGICWAVTKEPRIAE